MLQELLPQLGPRTILKRWLATQPRGAGPLRYHFHFSLNYRFHSGFRFHVHCRCVCCWFFLACVPDSVVVVAQLLRLLFVDVCCVVVFICALFICIGTSSSMPSSVSLMVYKEAMQSMASNGAVTAAEVCLVVCVCLVLSVRVSLCADVCCLLLFVFSSFFSFSSVLCGPTPGIGSVCVHVCV